MLRSSFLILLTLIVFLSFNEVHCQTTTSDSADATSAATGDSNEVTSNSADSADDGDDDDDDDDDEDSFDVTGDSDDDDSDDTDSDDTDSDDDSGDDSDDDDSDDDDSGDSDDDDSDGSDDDDSDDDDSGDSDDDDSGDDSGDDSDDSVSFDSEDTAEIDAFCAGLAADQCTEYADDDGYHLCALNANTQNCYGIVASDGIYGKGNFDSGYTAAQSTANAETQQLNTIVGVLGGIVGLLGIAGAFGGYYFYTKSKENAAPGAGTNEVRSMEFDDTVDGTAGQDGTALMDDDEL